MTKRKKKLNKAEIVFLIRQVYFFNQYFFFLVEKYSIINKRLSTVKSVCCLTRVPVCLDTYGSTAPNIGPAQESTLGKQSHSTYHERGAQRMDYERIPEFREQLRKGHWKSRKEGGDGKSGGLDLKMHHSLGRRTANLLPWTVLWTSGPRRNEVELTSRLCRCTGCDNFCNQQKCLTSVCSPSPPL